jgi:hypothetical protein
MLLRWYPCIRVVCLFVLYWDIKVNRIRKVIVRGIRIIRVTNLFVELEVPHLGHLMHRFEQALVSSRISQKLTELPANALRTH